MSDLTTDGSPQANAGRFGTFGGVFTPSILTILGVVMYLRLGVVTGEAGLAGILLVVVIAHLISYATGLSIASIATNRTVGAGGAYFMISRSLGAPAGAAIGIPLFFAQALSVTFYIVGFTEALMPLVPENLRGVLDPFMVSTGVNLILTLISLKSADLAIKLQYVVMGAIVLSLFSFFGGTTSEFPREIEWVASEGTKPFGEVFAIFFPAVTGIMAGVSMSGDLKDPRVSIPRGTLAAITVGFVVYLAFPIWLSLNFSNERLASDMDVVWDGAAFPQLIYLGVWGATLSSALGSIMTAPRTLQALAMDGMMPRYLGKTSGKDNEPRVGILLTFMLAQVGIFLGSLDAIAPLLTMFFLATYGMTNLACGLQKWAASPSFRPSFRVPMLISIGGGLACFYVMSYIDLLATMVAVIFCTLIFLVVERRTLDTTYGDARHGIWAALVRSSLQHLRRVDWHPLNWRPNLIILGGSPNKRPHLLRLGNAIVQSRGIVTYFQLILGSVQENAELRRRRFEKFEPMIAERFPNVFYKVDIVDDVYRGTVQIAQSYGVGNLQANTVMAGWPKKLERGEAYVTMCRDLFSLGCSLLVVKYDEKKQFGDRRSIHVWWGGLEGNGGLMLLIAFLLTANYEWRNARVTVLTVVDDEEHRETARTNLAKLLAAARLDAKPKVILRERRKISNIMAEESASADLALVGFRMPPEGEPVRPFFDRISNMLENLPTTILIHGARDFESEPLLFDDEEAPTRPPSDAEETAADAAASAAPAREPSPTPPTPDVPLGPVQDETHDPVEADIDATDPGLHAAPIAEIPVEAEGDALPANVEADGERGEG